MGKNFLFAKNTIDLKQQNVESTVFEFEVITDAQAIGGFEHDEYQLMMWERAEKDEGEERKLCLRVRHKNFDYDDIKDNISKNGYYHGGVIADEIIGIASLALRRRFRLGYTVRADDRPILFSEKKIYKDKDIVRGKCLLSEIEEIINLAEGLDEKYDLKFMLAVRLYHKAILFIEDEPDLSYLNLISAIEVLCQDTRVSDITLEDIDENLARIVNSLEEKEIGIQIEKAIIKRERLIKRKFIKFIIDYVNDSFWNSSDTRPGKISKEELPSYLGKIYDQRSKTLHNGEPFPPQVFDSPAHESDIDPYSLGCSVGEKRWDRKDYIPYPHFFERLVNHVLKNFLKMNQRQ